MSYSSEYYGWLPSFGHSREGNVKNNFFPLCTSLFQSKWYVRVGRKGRGSNPSKKKDWRVKMGKKKNDMQQLLVT